MSEFGSRGYAGAGEEAGRDGAEQRAGHGNDGGKVVVAVSRAAAGDARVMVLIAAQWIMASETAGLACLGTVGGSAHRSMTASWAPSPTAPESWVVVRHPASDAASCKVVDSRF